jgi:IclR family transcriptional regulator, acetate operon repressor
MHARNESGSNPNSGDSAQIRSVNRAFDVLACFTPRRPLATLTEIARQTGLAVSTTARLLGTLEAMRLVRRHHDGQYGMGTRLLEFGLTALSRSLYQVAETHLLSLVAASGETANLGVLTERGEVLYLRQVESPHAIRHASWAGRVVSAEGTAIGAAIRGLTNSRGFSATRTTLEPDVTAIAVPVYGALRQIVGALSITGPTFRISDDQVESYGLLLLDEAHKLCRTLGGA